MRVRRGDAPGLVMTTACSLTARIEDGLAARNRLCEAFFAREADRLADACREMSDRFLQGGRLLAFGRGPYATDAQHVSVEFVHPVIVGKRALPALDLSIEFRRWLDAILLPHDMVMGFGPPGGDSLVQDALDTARVRRPHDVMTFALPGDARLVPGRPGYRGPFHPPGNPRDAVPHAVGDGARLLRASRAGA